MKYFLVICLAITSCAKIPIQAIELSDALKDEGDRMHLLNLALIDKMFQEKRHMVNEFITNEYTPAYIDNFKKLLPPGTDFKTDFSEITQAIYPRINATKDSLMGVLNEQRVGIINKLNDDYRVYDNAFSEMQNLLRSANKLNQQQSGVYQQVKTLSNNRIDLEGIDKALNNFIRNAGSISAKATVLTSTINSFLK